MAATEENVDARGQGKRPRACAIGNNTSAQTRHSTTTDYSLNLKWKPISLTLVVTAT